MRLDMRFTRGIQLALAGTIAAASLASPAAADHWRRYKYPPRHAHVYVAPAPGRVYISHSSCGAPALAGFVGGLVIGSVIAHAAPPPPVYCAPPPAYVYYDPDCGRSFTSLDLCASHYCGYGHPRVVQVIEVDSGRCVGERYWFHGRWYDGDERGDWDD